MQALNPLTPSELSLMLVSFGLSGAVGTVSGGWAVDRFGPVRTLRVQFIVLTAMMALVPLTAGSVPLTIEQAARRWSSSSGASRAAA